MSKKLHSKLLSVILCIAICCATLCGSIIAVNAAAADFNGTYTISVGDEKQAVPFGSTEVKAQVKFDLPAGFVGGQFTAVAQDSYTIGDVVAVAGTQKDGTPLELIDTNGDPVVTIVPKEDGDNKKVRFVIGDGVLCSSITFEYTIMLIDNPTTTNVVDDYVANGTTTKYPVSITLSEDDLVQFATYDLQDVTFTASAESDGWFHSHSSWYGTNGVVLDAENNGKHTVVTNARCHWCTTSVANGGLGLNMSDNYIAQVLPDYTEFDGATTPVIADGDTDGDAHTAWIGISGATVRYNENGGLDVDVHVYSQYRTGNNDKVVLFVCDEEGNELYRLGPVANGTSYYAGNGLHANTKMFTINGLSARDIEKNLLLTAIEYSSGAIEHSRTMPFCLADYCESVVDGNGAVWASGATQEQIEADKDVAAALYYYGAAIDESVFDKNTSGGGTTSNIEYVNKTADTWDGSRSEPKDIDNDGIFDITSAEELAWVALVGGSKTAGNTYRVSNDLGAIYVNTGYDNSSYENLKSSLSTKQNWINANPANAFQGSFDGNGVIIYGIYSGGQSRAGLFPMATGSLSFKNVMVKDSYITATHMVGGIMGAPEISTSSDISDITFENCIVTDCYLEKTRTEHVNGWDGLGGLAGCISGPKGSVTVNNCVVLDNNYSISSSIPYAMFGEMTRQGNYVNNAWIWPEISYSNIITDIAPWSASNDSYIDGVNNYSNIYTTVALNDYYYYSSLTDSNMKQISDSEMTGTDTITTMNLSSDEWVATSGYPELSVFHKLVKTPVDENTHKEICLIKTGSASCSFKGLTEEHTFLKNAEGTLLVCECGYSKEIIGNTITPKNKSKVTWDGSKPANLEASGITGGGTSTDPYIIKTPAQLYYVVQKAVDESAGNYYEIDKDIAVFDMAGNTYDWTSNNANFQGHLNGNGVEIINLKTSGWDTGLIPRANNGATIENIKVTGATIAGNSGGDHAGVLVGNVTGGTVTVKGCAIVDSTVTADDYVGALIGLVGNNNSAVISNCFISNNTVTTRNSDYASNRMIGAGGWNAGKITVDNSIVIGNDKQTVSSSTKLYDSSSAKTGIGAVAAMGLGDAWFDTASYPELDVFHDMIDIYVDEDTHKSVCQVYIDGTQQCTTCGPTEEHVLDTNAEGTAKVCSCGYSIEINGSAIIPNQKTDITWDGKTKTPITDADKDENGIYIITTAEQLAWLAVSGGSNTAGNTYKVADGIGAIYINKGYDNSSFENLKASLSSNDAWHTLNPAATAFQGTFDGNGVTIYGFRGNDNASSGGLFPYIAGDVTFKNINIKDSYVTGAANIGILSGGGNPNETSPITSITIENCSITNNYIERTKNPTNGHGWSNIAGLVGWAGKVTGSVYINNCSVYDNRIDNNSTTQKTRAFLGGITQNGVLVNGGYTWPTQINISNSFSDLDVYNTQQYTNQPQYFNNVYTTADVSGNSTANGTFTDSNIKVLSSASDMQGLGAVEAMNLDSTKWFDTTGYPELHVFHDMATVTIDANTHQYVCQIFINGTQCTTCRAAVSHTMVDAPDGTSASCDCGYSYEIKGIHAMGLPTSILNRITSNATFAEKFATNALFRAAYNEDVFGTQVQANVFDMYTTSLNLKVNPHIAFMFAFHNDYKTNRGNITVTFTVDGQTYTTEAVETNGTLGTNWVNNSGAGRYHLYRFKQLPVTKLCKDVKVTVNYNGQSFDFGTYSAAGYAINAMNAGEDYMYHVNASMALVYYSEMLAARAGV